MIFNSLEFLVFFSIFFTLYHIVLKERTRTQNVFLLLSSYFFYGWANWKILPLLILTTIIFYFLGIAINDAKTDKRKTIFMLIGLVFGIGSLLYFKYFNFFITSFKTLFESFGLQTNLHTFKIILPIGISFYTFRLLSYVIDIHLGKFTASRNFIDFASFVAFFPCILSGPIDRPSALIPQIQNKRVFDYSLAVNGCRQILWGLFKKIVIADTCAIYVNHVFANYQTHAASTLVIGIIFFSFQLYADFSGYSDMAIGIGKLLGFNITKNFNYPFFSQNIAEYWRNWHISFTSWLTDYVFMPLNIKWRDYGNLGIIGAILITFLLVGLWHGDNWNFVAFGLYHGLLYIPLILTGVMFKKNKLETNKLGLPKLSIAFNFILTFILVCIGNILFRSDNLGHAIGYISSFADKNLFSFKALYNKKEVFMSITLIIIMLVIEWIGRKESFGFEKLGTGFKKPIRILMYSFIFFVIFMFVQTDETPFIYLQF